MKTIIAGSRKFDIPEHFRVAMDVYYAEHEITEVVSGGAMGADWMGEQWARDHDVAIKRFSADWDQHGKAAGPIRNRQMAEYADCAVVFWDGTSRGTKNMIDEMRKAGKPCKVIYINARML